MGSYEGRVWSQNIVIDGRPQGEYWKLPMGQLMAQVNKYNSEVAAVLDSLKAVKTGAAVLAAVEKAGKRIFIRPFPEEGNSLNAYANSKEDKHYAPAPRFVPSEQRCVANGPVGGDTNIMYSPETWRYWDSLLGWDANGGPNGSGAFVPTSTHPDITPYDPDGTNTTAGDMLVHEMFHCARAMQGMFCKIPMATYDNTEEFFAITVEDVYRSELGQVLRADHGPQFKSLTADSGVFYRQNLSQIESLWKEMPDFCGAMAKIQTNFNPFLARTKTSVGAPVSTAFDDLHENKVDYSGAGIPLGRLNVPRTPDRPAKLPPR